MKKRFLITMASTLCCILPALSGEAPISVRWEMGENGVKPGYYSSRFVITNVSDSVLGDGWGILLQHFPEDCGACSRMQG